MTEQCAHRTTCTLCSLVESPGFYTGCMIQDGLYQIREWSCDGKGNLTRLADIQDRRLETVILTGLDGGLRGVLRGDGNGNLFDIDGRFAGRYGEK